MIRLVRGALWAVGVLSLLVGCAARRQESYLRDRAAEHVYRQPLAQIWPRVKAVIEDQGYYFDEVPGAFLLETDWKQVSSGSSIGSSSTRLLVQGEELKEGGFRLRVLRNDVSSRAVLVQERTMEPITNPTSAMVDAAHRETTIRMERYKRAERDLAMEWELLRAIEPETAAALEKDAQAKFPK